jgi:hypothetical protein
MVSPITTLNLSIKNLAIFTKLDDQDLDNDIVLDKSLHLMSRSVENLGLCVKQNHAAGYCRVP